MSQRDETGKEFDKMSNESIRERMRKYTEGCRLSYIEIGKAAGLGEPSRYIISRFLKGLQLNPDTLAAIDKYLSAKGY